MGPFVVVYLFEVTKAQDLFRQAIGRRACRIPLQGQVHAFMTAVLLRLARLNTFGQNTDLDQLHRQP